MIRFPLYRRPGGPQGRSGWVRKISPPPGSDRHTVASRYTDWAVPYSFVRACFLSAGYKTIISCRAVLKPAGVATSWRLLVHLNYCRLSGLSHNRFGVSSKGRHIYRQTKLPTGMVDDFYWDICSLEKIFLDSRTGGSGIRTAVSSTCWDPGCVMRFCVCLLNSVWRVAPRFNWILQTRTANSTTDICQQRAGKAKSRTFVISHLSWWYPSMCCQMFHFKEPPKRLWCHFHTSGNGLRWLLTYLETHLCRYPPLVESKGSLVLSVH
jgi:hypothetical protein